MSRKGAIYLNFRICVSGFRKYRPTEEEVEDVDGYLFDKGSRLYDNELRFPSKAWKTSFTSSA